MIRNISFTIYQATSGAHFSSNGSIKQDCDIPDICPRCGVTVTPIILPSIAIEQINRDFDLVTALYCQHCRKPFFATYKQHDSCPTSVGPQSFRSRSFDEHISNLSPSFVEVYNQAYAAESQDLNEISGMGYRKAIEYLIKDYLIYRDPDNEETIKKEALGSCINNRVDNPKMKASARGAVWLGNDFTHYERKYGEYEIRHLKQYIDAAVFWILMELTTDDADSMDRR